MYKTIRRIAACIPLLATACAGPTYWSEHTFAELTCEMTVEEVEAASEGRLEAQSGVSPDGTTHIIFDRSSYIRIAMPTGKLQRADLCWDYKMMAVACAEWPKLRCGSNGT